MQDPANTKNGTDLEEFVLHNFLGPSFARSQSFEGISHKDLSNKKAMHFSKNNNLKEPLNDFLLIISLPLCYSLLWIKGRKQRAIGVFF